eukprot:m.284636 g.284636  ORF g.284636 m.284636 type:complete len:72 (-) comp27022_c0_seq2:69-284(-)
MFEEQSPNPLHIWKPSGEGTESGTHNGPGIGEISCHICLHMGNHSILGSLVIGQDDKVYTYDHSKMAIKVC